MPVYIELEYTLIKETFGNAHKSKHQDLDLVLRGPISVSKLRPSQKFQEREMCVFHIEDSTLLGVNMGPVNDNALQLIHFESS